MIDKATGKLAPPTQTDNVESQEKQILYDGMSRYCIDCTHDDADKGSPSVVTVTYSAPPPASKNP